MIWEFCGLILMNRTKIPMNDQFSEPSHTPETEAQSEAKREFTSLTEALETGREDGAAKAKATAPELKTGIANVVHDVAYGLAYGTVFAGAFVNELIPGRVREGFAKGADAGRKDGKTACEKAAAALAPDSHESAPPIIS